MAIFESLGKYRNTGLLLLRAGTGISFMIHGYPKLAGGPETWEAVGGTMKLVGIDFMPLAWGFLAALSEGIGGFLLLLGLFFRPAALCIFITMCMATFMHISKGDGQQGAAHAIDLGLVVLSLVFIGPGKYSIDKK